MSAQEAPIDNAVSYVEVNRLAVGLFVFVDLPWFRHPFAFDRFKIKSESQIAQLRELGVPRFRYDPARSDVGVDEAAATTDGAARAGAAPDTLVPDSESAAVEQSAEDAARAARRARNAARRMHLAKVERAFLNSARVVREATQNLTARPTESVTALNELIGEMAGTLLAAPDVTLHSLADRIGHTETYSHELNTAILSLMLACQLDLPLDEAAVLGLGALVHDIGLSEIPDRVTKKREALTRPESELRKMHCEYGVRRGHEIGLPPAVLAIIGQHHECWDGSGYPKAVSADRIHPLARIVALANEYDNLCNPIDVMRALTPYEALSVLFTQRRNRFEGKVLQMLVRQLGVYPPGTVVALSDDRLGLVVSVNTKAPLRPDVAVYEPGVPKDEAGTLVLARTPEINIAKAIRPGELPREAFDYLNPRRRVAYYFDTDSHIEEAPAVSEAAA